MWQTGSYSNKTDNFKVKNRLEKVHRICAEFTTMVRRICKLHAQNFQLFAAEFWQPYLQLGFDSALRILQFTLWNHNSLMPQYDVAGRRYAKKCNNIWLTSDFGTFPRFVTFLLCFSLANLIFCFGAIMQHRRHSDVTIENANNRNICWKCWHVKTTTNGNGNELWIMTSHDARFGFEMIPLSK